MKVELMVLFLMSVVYWALFFYVRKTISREGLEVTGRTIISVLVAGAIMIVFFIAITYTNWGEITAMLFSAIQLKSIIDVLLSIAYLFIIVTVIFNILLWTFFLTGR